MNNVSTDNARKIVNRALAWAIMGTVLIVALVVGIAGASYAMGNKEGVTATIVLGSIALAILLIACAYNYFKRTKEVPLVPADEEPAVDEQPAVTDATAATIQAADEESVCTTQEAAPQEAVMTDVVDVAEDAADEIAVDEAVAEMEAAEEAAEAQEQAEGQEQEQVQEQVQEQAVAEATAQEEQEEPAAVVPQVNISAEEAHNSMSDEDALALIEVRSRTRVDGPMCTVYVGMLSATFEENEPVTLAALEAKGLIPRKQHGYIVLAKGNVTKALTVIANDFSADAVKMIVAAGGKAIGC